MFFHAELPIVLLHDILATLLVAVLSTLHMLRLVQVYPGKPLRNIKLEAHASQLSVLSQ